MPKLPSIFRKSDPTPEALDLSTIPGVEPLGSFPEFARLDARLDALTVRQKEIRARLSELHNLLDGNKHHAEAVRRLLDDDELPGIPPGLPNEAELRSEQVRLKGEDKKTSDAIAAGQAELKTIAESLRQRRLEKLRAWHREVAKGVVRTIGQLATLARLDREARNVIEREGFSDSLPYLLPYGMQFDTEGSAFIGWLRELLAIGVVTEDDVRGANIIPPEMCRAAS